MILPKRHVADWFEMTTSERSDADDLARVLAGRMREEDRAIQGFNIGANCGQVAGQTVPHAHIHLIPRRAGDTPDPRGGVRGVIPARMSYLG